MASPRHPHRPYLFIYGRTPAPRDSVAIYAKGVTYDPRVPVCTAPERMWPAMGEAGYRNRAEKSAWNRHRLGHRAGVTGITLRDHRRGAMPKGVV
jgi:hypothetical protein